MSVCVTWLQLLSSMVSYNGHSCSLFKKRTSRCWQVKSIFVNKKERNYFVIGSLSWAILIACCPLSIFLYVCLSVNFSHFHLLQNQLSISPKLGTKHPWVKGIQVCSNEGPRPFPRGDNYEIVKIHWRNLKIFFSRTTGPISAKLGTKYPWVKGI